MIYPLDVIYLSRKHIFEYFQYFGFARKIYFLCNKNCDPLNIYFDLKEFINMDFMITEVINEDIHGT